MSSQIGFEFEFNTDLSDYKLKKLFNEELGIVFKRNEWRIVDDFSVSPKELRGWTGRELISPPLTISNGKRLLKRILKILNEIILKSIIHVGFMSIWILENVLNV